MIKAIAAFFSKMRMGYCTLVNGTVSDTSMQYRSSIVIKNYKNYNYKKNYKQIPTGYIKEVYSIVLQFIECNPFHYTSNHH